MRCSMSIISCALAEGLDVAAVLKADVQNVGSPRVECIACATCWDMLRICLMQFHSMAFPGKYLSDRSVGNALEGQA